MNALTIVYAALFYVATARLRRRPGAEDPQLPAHAGAAEDPDHAGADHHHRRRVAPDARGGAVREPVQGQQVDLAVRLDVPCRAAAGAAAPPALLPAAGVDADRLGAGLRHLRRLRDGRRPGRAVGAALPGRPRALHLHAVGPPAPGAAARHRRQRPGHALRRPHRHRRAEGLHARADASSTCSRCRPTRCCCCT